MKNPTIHSCSAETLDLPSFLPYRLSILEHRVSKAIAQHYVKSFNLSRMQWRALATLATYERISARDICDITHLDKMQVSRAVNHLKQEGLVVQKQSKTDQRTQELSLTKKGCHVYQQIIPLVKQEEQRILSLLSENEQKQLIGILDKLEQSFA